MSYVRISHTNPTFAAAVGEIDAELSEMFALTERALERACKALRERDLELARAVVAGDKAINAIEGGVAVSVATTIARHQPVAHDVHALIGSIQIAQELERIGDHAKNVCGRLRHLDKDWEVIEPFADRLNSLGATSLEMLREFIAAAAADDRERIASVWRRDARVNELYKGIVNRLLESDAATELRPVYNLFAVGKDFERIGDRIKNLTEIAHYQRTGSNPDYEEEEDLDSA